MISVFPTSIVFAGSLGKTVFFINSSGLTLKSEIIASKSVSFSIFTSTREKKANWDDKYYYNSIKEKSIITHTTEWHIGTSESG